MLKKGSFVFETSATVAAVEITTAGAELRDQCIIRFDIVHAFTMLR